MQQVQPQHHQSYLQHIKQQFDGAQAHQHHHAQAMAQSAPHHFASNTQFGVTSPSPLPLILNAPSRAFSGDIDWSSLMSYIDAPNTSHNAGAMSSHVESPPSSLHTIVPPHMQTPSPQTAHRNTQWLTLPSPPPPATQNVSMSQQQYNGPHPLFAMSQMSQSNAIAAVIPSLLPVSVARPHYDSGIVYRKASCEPCYKVKTSCDGRRPCERCIRLERESLCVERIPKIKERRNGKANNAATAQAAAHSHGSAEKDKSATDSVMKKEKKRRRSGDETKSESHSHHNGEESKAGKSDRDSGGVEAVVVEPQSEPNHEHSSNSSIHSPDASLTVDDDERRLSQMMLSAFLADPTTTDLIRAALNNRKLPNIAMPIFLSYIAHALHPEDFAQLSATIAGPPATPITHAGDPFFLCLPDSRFFPRISYPFGQSPDEAAIDSTIHVNVAMMTISRASSTTPTQAAREKEIAMAVQNMQLLRRLQEKPLTAQTEHTNAEFVSATATTDDDALSPSPSLSPSLSSHSSHDATSPPHVLPSRTPSSATWSSSDPHPSFPSVDMRIQVNREFERLFGYSQRQLKDMCSQEGIKAIYRLYHPKEIKHLVRVLIEGTTGHKAEHRIQTTIINRWKGETQCVLQTRLILDSKGFYQSSAYAWTPIT